MNTRSAQTVLALLRGLARLSRRRGPTTDEALAARAGCEPADVRPIVAWLARHGLVSGSGTDLRLTLAGLAYAVASRPGNRDVHRPHQRTSRAA